MKAEVGSRIVLAPPTVDAPLRDGEVLETGPDGTPPFLIRWSNGHTGLFFPGPGSVASIGEEPATPTGHAPPPDAEQQVTAPPITATGDRARHVHDWQVRITIFESDDDTHAKVVLLADSPQRVTAQGDSVRAAHDKVVPEIGDEIAVARALRHLADHLIATAEGDIAALTGEQEVAVRPT
jgi:hypothetical protein